MIPIYGDGECTLIEDITRKAVHRFAAVRSSERIDLPPFRLSPAMISVATVLTLSGRV